VEIRTRLVPLLLMLSWRILSVEATCTDAEIRGAHVFYLLRPAIERARYRLLQIYTIDLFVLVLVLVLVPVI